jgi:hypothetical protein
LYLHMEASQHSLLAACFTLHSINATLAIVPQRGAGLWITSNVNICPSYLSMALHPFAGPWPLFQFLDLFTQSVGLLGQGISPS